MGGQGSGRPRSDVKVVEDTPFIDAGELHRRGLFEEPERSLEGGPVEAGVLWIATLIERDYEGAVIQLHFYTRLFQKGWDVTLELYRNPRRPGGREWWFRCPFVARGKACGKRTERLYLPLDTPTWGCRECHGLMYASTRDEDPRLQYWLAHPDELQTAIKVEIRKWSEAPTDNPPSPIPLGIMWDAERLLREKELRKNRAPKKKPPRKKG